MFKGFDSVPFLATSFDDAAKLWKSAKEPLTKLLDSQGLVLLYSVPWPPQGLYFKKEVNSVADMKGIKFRSYNNATARLAELTGMLPVSIEAAEEPVVIALSIKPALKADTDAIFEDLGISTAQAIIMFLKQVQLHKALPFELKFPDPSKPRVAGLNQRQSFMSDDFDEPLNDAFWLG